MFYFRALNIQGSAGVTRLHTSHATWASRARSPTAPEIAHKRRGASVSSSFDLVVGGFACGKATSIQMAGHQVIGGYFLHLRLDFSALPHGERTAWMEVTAGGWINR